MAKNNAGTTVRFGTNDSFLFGTNSESGQDKRVQRTRRDLHVALLQLMVERGYESLSVQDILDRSGVGRATFYQHYRGKDDLLRRSLGPLRQHLLAEWQRESAGGKKQDNPLGFVLPFLRHVDSHRVLYRVTVGRESWTIVHREMTRMLEGFLADAMNTGPAKCKELATELSTHFIVGALMSVVAWWLDHRPSASPEEIGGLFLQMTEGALAATRRK